MEENKININWFPGHMAKAKRKILESMRQVDAVVEIRDARIPLSSHNPDLESIIGAKPRIIVLGKSDLANENENLKWTNYYKKMGVPCVLFNPRDRNFISNFKNSVNKLMAQKLERWKNRGMIGRSIKLMIVGIPNVGKSTLINRFIGASKAKTENRPGVTRANQWFSVGKNIQVLDTPGVLWPKFDDESVSLNLAFTGAIKGQILDTEDLAVRFLEMMREHYIDSLVQRYNLDQEKTSNMSGLYILKCIAKSRGMLLSGGEVDTLRAANIVLDEFKTGKLGKITLEKVEMLEN